MQFYNQKPIRLIELFAGIGSQAKALKNLDVDFEHWRVCEFDEHAIRSYNAVHGTNFVTSDITKISAEDLNITDTDQFTYLLVYSFPCQDLSNAGKGSDMADSVTGGGLHGKDLSKADVSVNIYAFLKAQETNEVVSLSCAIGDDTIDGRPYSEIVEIARNYINEQGGFEKFAEWGLV